MSPLFNQYWKLLVTYLQPQKHRVILLGTLIFGNLILQLINPQIIGRFIDMAQSGTTIQEAINIALLFFVLTIVQQVVAVFATYVSENVGWTATNSLRADLTDHCLRLDQTFHNSQTPGKMIEQIDGDVTTLSNFFSQFVIQILSNTILIIGVLILLYVKEWRMGLTITGFVLVVLITLGRLRGISIPYWKDSRKASTDLFGFMEERLSGIEDIYYNGAQAYIMKKFHKLVQICFQQELKAGFADNILINTISLLFALGIAVSLMTGTYYFRIGLITLGTVYVLFHYTTMLMDPIHLITEQIQDLQRAAASTMRIQELFSRRNRIQTNNQNGGNEDMRLNAFLLNGALTVHFQNVSFSYKRTTLNEQKSEDEITNDNQKETVLQDLTFQLEAGTVLGLLGRTGSGKTTITRLLFRFYDPDKGLIQLGDAEKVLDICQIPVAYLRQRIGLVTQDIQLFGGTIRDNITFFDQSVLDKKILEIIEDLQLSRWYQSLPNGLNTKLAAGGTGLSVGERQLLAFLRVFLKDPGVVILDEAASHLDPATEKMIDYAIDRLVENRTAIIIAHRLKTVERADEIMILENGHIYEYDSRLKLANDPQSQFYNLLRMGHIEEVLE